MVRCIESYINQVITTNNPYNICTQILVVITMEMAVTMIFMNGFYTLVFICEHTLEQ